MTDNAILKIMGWANKDGKHDARLLRRARDLVDAAKREREAEIRETLMLSERNAFEREMRRLGYDTKANGSGVYFWPEVRAMWRGWGLMSARVAAENLFGAA